MRGSACYRCWMKRAAKPRHHAAARRAADCGSGPHQIEAFA
jgi:hypothetical protein